MAKKDCKTAEDFFNLFKRSCAKALEGNKYLTVAYLAYNYENPGIFKVLKDNSLFQALDAATGKDIVLFYIEPCELERDYNKIKKRNRPNSLFPEEQKLTDLISQPLPQDETPISVAAYFLKELGYTKFDNISLPFIIFFNINAEAEIVKHL